MKITTRYPALVRGRVPRMTSDRTIFCLPEGHFEIPEISMSDAPLALVVTGDNKKIEYRQYNGQLFTSLKEPNALDSHMLSASHVMNKANQIFGEIRAQITDYVFRSRETLATRPERLNSILGSKEVDSGVIEQAKTDASSIIVTDTSTSDLTHWQAKARDRMAQLVMIDGTPWQRTPEPSYEVNFLFANISVCLTDIYLNIDIETGDPEHFSWRDVYIRYFSAADVDGMNACLSRVGILDKGIKQGGSIEVIIPDALQKDFDVLELDRVSRVLVRDFEKHLRYVTTKEVANLRRVPREAFVAAGVLRDATVARKQTDAIDEGLAAALENYLDVMDRNKNLCEEMNYENSDKLIFARDILDTWCNREVVVPMGGPLFP